MTTSPEQAIREAFPGDDDLHRSVRIALLRVLHFARNVQHDTGFIYEWLDSAISDPPWCLWYGPIRPTELVKDLRRAANEIEKAVIALDAARPKWQRFSDSEGTTDHGVRGDRSGTEIQNETEPPF